MRTFLLQVERMLAGDIIAPSLRYGEGLVLSVNPCVTSCGDAINLVVSYADGKEIVQEVYSAGCKLEISRPSMERK